MTAQGSSGSSISEILSPPPSSHQLWSVVLPAPVSRMRALHGVLLWHALSMGCYCAGAWLN